MQKIWIIVLGKIKRIYTAPYCTGHVILFRRQNTLCHNIANLVNQLSLVPYTMAGPFNCQELRHLVTQLLCQYKYADLYVNLFLRL